MNNRFKTLISLVALTTLLGCAKRSENKQFFNYNKPATLIRKHNILDFGGHNVGYMLEFDLDGNKNDAEGLMIIRANNYPCVLPKIHHTHIGDVKTSTQWEQTLGMSHKTFQPICLVCKTSHHDFIIPVDNQNHL